MPDADCVAVIGRREAGLADAVWLVTSCTTGGWTVLAGVFSSGERLLIFRDMKALNFSDVDGSIHWRKNGGERLRRTLGQEMFPPRKCLRG
jgi:hypothetical protein